MCGDCWLPIKLAVNAAAQLLMPGILSGVYPFTFCFFNVHCLGYYVNDVEPTHTQAILYQSIGVLVGVEVVDEDRHMCRIVA